MLVHDSDGNTKEVDPSELKFRVSVYGVLKDQDTFLVSWNPEIKRYTLPGGSVDLGEKLEDALIRECQEETGLVVKVGKLLNVIEDFYMIGLEQVPVHSILIFYEVEKIGGELMTEGNGDDSDKAEFLSIEDLKKHNFQENFLAILK